MGFSAEAASFNLTPPKGILIVGVQGCGKSLAARVIARQWALPLLKLEAGRLYDGPVGQSEKNFRRATGRAESIGVYRNQKEQWNGARRRSAPRSGRGP